MNPGNNTLHEGHLNVILTDFVRRMRSQLIQIYFACKNRRATNFNTSAKAWEVVLAHQHKWKTDLFQAFWQIGGGESWCDSELSWRQWLHDALLVAAEIRINPSLGPQFDPKEIGELIDKWSADSAMGGSKDAPSLRTTFTTQASIAFAYPEDKDALAGPS